MPPAHLFSPLVLRGLTLRNRIGMSPMCQYSCTARDGMAGAWHLQHYGARAVGGVALVIVEATAVEARGRISPQDLGLWEDEQIAPLARTAAAIAEQGAVPGIQLAHAGRKAGTARPWEGGKPLPADEAWEPVAPSALAFSAASRVPHALTPDEIVGIIAAFTRAARRAVAAGFELIELHAAHGYLLHSFHSPIANLRSDDYGGSFENRVRLTRQIAQAVRAELGAARALAVRLSASDWIEGGWTLDESAALAALLRADGVDLIDCSSGGIAPRIPIPVAPGYQVGFAEHIRRVAAIPTAAVGLITEPDQAEAIVRDERANVVLLGRALLADPYWALHAARHLGGAAGALMPAQYRWTLE